MEAKAIKEEIIDKEYNVPTGVGETSRRSKNIHVNGKDRSGTPEAEDMRKESPSHNPNGTLSPPLNGNVDSLSPPLTSGQDLTYPHTRNAATSPLSKLRKFLSALIQFASDLGPETSDRVRSLTHSLLSGVLSLEEFQVGLQETTNYPLRASVPGFLRALLPHAQRELLLLARQSKQSPLQYIRSHEYLFLENSPIGDATEYFASLPQTPLASEGSLKRRIEALYEPPQTNGSAQLGDAGSVDYPQSAKRPHQGTSFMNPTPLLYPLHNQHMFDYHGYQSFQSHDQERRADMSSAFEQSRTLGPGVAKSDDEWKNINTMLNCILSMVEKTKRALAILQQRGLATDLSPEGNDIKRVANEIMAATVRQTEDRVAEVRRRAEEAVNQVKRQALVDLQRAVATAETKAVELVTAERTKMERLLEQARRHQRPTPPPTTGDSPGPQQNSCWNCGRKAQETCSGCNLARYCGSFCQHKDWESHHQVCSSTRDQKPQQSTISPTTSAATKTTPPAQDRTPEQRVAVVASDRANIVALNNAQNLIGGVGGKQ